MNHLTALHSRAHIGSVVGKFKRVGDDQKLRSSSNKTLYVHPLSKKSILAFLGNEKARNEIRTKREDAVKESCASFDKTYGEGTAERIGLVGKSTVTVGEVKQLVAELHVEGVSYVVEHAKPAAIEGLQAIGQAWDEVAEKTFNKVVDKLMEVVPGRAQPAPDIVTAALIDLYSSGKTPTEDDVLRRVKCLKSEELDQDTLLKHTKETISRHCKRKDQQTHQLKLLSASDQDAFLRGNDEDTAIIYHQMRVGFKSCKPQVQTAFTNLLGRGDGPEQLEDKMAGAFTVENASLMPDSLCEHFAAAHAAIVNATRDLPPEQQAGLLNKMKCQFALRVLVPLYFEQAIKEPDPDTKKYLMKRNAEFQKSVNQGNSAYGEFMNRVIAHGTALLDERG
jgi:hypothetical protein